MHGVQTGSRTDLPEFMQKLLDNRHLAMDFWAFVAKLSSREGGEFSDDQVLAVVAEGVADGELSEDDDDAKRAIDNLRAMLAGVDIQNPGQSQVEPAPFPRSEPRPRFSHEEHRIHTVESSFPEPDSRAAFGSDAADEETVRKTKLPPPVQLDEALLRLELTRLVKQYFESIDKSKLDAAADAAPVASPTTRRSLEEPDPGDELAHRPIGKSRLVLEPIASSSEAPAEAHPIRVPLADYPSTGGYWSAILLLIIVVTLFQGGFAIYGHRAQLLNKISASSHEIRQKTVAWALSDLKSSPAADPKREPSISREQPTERPVDQAPLQGTSTPPPAPSHAANTTDPVMRAIPQTAATVAPHNGSNGTAEQAVVPVDRESEDVIPSSDLAGAVRVAPSVMDAHLVASRVPVYPEAAKIDGIEGSVVMQAIISTDGTVKRVHVLEGDSHLRSAAVEAAYKRRYRPYLLNGQPVDVATTITVDFDLDQ
jgi:TonB family protein